MPMPASFDLPRLNDRSKASLANLKPGRRAGILNVITRDLKRGIIDAAVECGSDGNGTGGLPGFLGHLARNHPKAFTQLLCKLLPMQVHGEGLAGAVVSTVNVVSIPVDRYLSAEQLEKIQQAPLQLDQAPLEQSEPEHIEELAEIAVENTGELQPVADIVEQSSMSEMDRWRARARGIERESEPADGGDVYRSRSRQRRGPGYPFND